MGFFFKDEIVICLCLSVSLSICLSISVFVSVCAVAVSEHFNQGGQLGTKYASSEGARRFS